MRITRAEKHATVYDAARFQPTNMPEIAIVGRSNAGKSSLINKLCNNGKLARVSSAPGKTRSINFFKINDAFMLVDLPGYGYAKRSRGEQQQWASLVEGYFQQSTDIRWLLLLCDIRHEPSEGDRQMVAYMQYYKIPFTLIATKCDKIAKSKRGPMAQKIAKQLGAEHCLWFSAMDGAGKEELLQELERIVGWE